ncbi:MAG: hypothetical protein R6U89_03530 [Dehalococcoidia bacterium]
MKRLILIIAVCIALVLALPGCGDDDDSDGSGFEIAASGAVALIDSHISSVISDMEVVAMTSEIKSGDWERMEPLLAELKQDEIPAVLWFVLPDGSYFTVEKGKVDENLSDRSYFPGLMDGRNQISGLLTSKSTGKKMFVAAVPVWSDGEVIGGLGASVLLDGLSGVLTSELQLPSDMFFYVTDESGKVALHSNTALIMEESSDIENGRVVATKKSELMGWNFALAYMTEDASLD